MKNNLKYSFLTIFMFISIFVSKQKCLAGSIISSSVTLTQTNLNSYSWPVTINGGSSGAPVIVTLAENVILTNAQNYFIINGNYITIEGNNKTITISGISFYTGLIKNGFYELVRTFDPNDPDAMPTETVNSTNGFNNLTIQNLGVLAVNSDVAAGQGWIGQASFALNANNNLITNCYSNGPLRQSSGGILGEKSYGTVTKSYSTGAHIGGYAGGIFGSEGHGTAINCFSTSPSFGNRGGGIFGGVAKNATAINCYSTGIIGPNAGGIFGGFTENSTATNCYSSGSIGSNAGGIFGGNSANVTATNSYIANNSWVNTDANTALTGEDGSVWRTSVTPYTLAAFPPAAVLSNFASVTKTYFDGAYIITPPTSNNTGEFTYISSNTNVATINGTTVTLVEAGTTTITATQVADATYSSGSINANLTVNGVTVLTKYGEMASTNVNYVDKFGGLNSSEGLDSKGGITTAKTEMAYTTTIPFNTYFDFETATSCDRNVCEDGPTAAYDLRFAAGGGSVRARMWWNEQYADMALVYDKIFDQLNASDIARYYYCEHINDGNIACVNKTDTPPIDFIGIYKTNIGNYYAVKYVSEDNSGVTFQYRKLN